MRRSPVDAVQHPGSDFPVVRQRPSSGEDHGKVAAWEYLGKVAEVSGGRGGFVVHSITTDDHGHGVALLTGTVRDYVRQMIHVWHVKDGRITEFWDAYLDAAAEDAFWNTALTQQPR